MRSVFGSGDDLQRWQRDRSWVDQSWVDQVLYRVGLTEVFRWREGATNQRCWSSIPGAKEGVSKGRGELERFRTRLVPKFVSWNRWERWKKTNGGFCTRSRNLFRPRARSTLLFKWSNQRINWASWTHDTEHLSWLAMVSILENNQREAEIK
nr:hypothetical protein CFP56_22953 [Quercus suber]